MIKLVEKDQVVEHEGFEKHTSIEINSTKIDLYIEKALLKEFSNHTIVIDARTWNLFGKLKGSLFITYT